MIASLPTPSTCIFQPSVLVTWLPVHIIELVQLPRDERRDFQGKWASLEVAKDMSGQIAIAAHSKDPISRLYTLTFHGLQIDLKVGWPHWPKLSVKGEFCDVTELWFPQLEETTKGSVHLEWCIAHVTDSWLKAPYIPSACGTPLWRRPHKTEESDLDDANGWWGKLRKSND
jgi:hypothetical protein